MNSFESSSNTCFTRLQNSSNVSFTVDAVLAIDEMLPIDVDLRIPLLVDGCISTFSKFVQKRNKYNYY